MSESKFHSIQKICNRDLKPLEMWPSYFSRRYFEFLSFYELLPKKHFGHTLEIGCSVGYYSAFLSVISDKVTATDQPESDIAIHNGNFEKANKLLSHLKISNVALQPATVESLPFADNTFDFVFSSHVLGYLKDQKKAVSEIHRVLKPHGVHFCVVPSRFTTLVRLIEYHVYLVKRVCALGMSRFTSKKVSGHPAVTSQSAAKPKHISLLPKTQGAQETWAEEVVKTSHRYWKELVRDDSKVKPVLQISTQVCPALPLLSLFSPGLAAKFYGITRRLEMKLGSLKLLKPLGLNVVLIQEKI